MLRSSRAAALAPAVVILAVFLSMAGEGLQGFFAPDEMMNLYRAWSPPLTQLLRNDRPAGILVYRALFGLFGLNPLPYRVVCLTLLLANLALLYAFCLRLGRSREIAALACLLGAYHAYLADFYYTSSAIFDLLCFFFSYLALVIYLDIRGRGRDPNLWQACAVLALYVFAMASKEMAVIVPALMIAYEALHWFQQPRSKHPPRAAVILSASMAALTVAYIGYKTLGAHRMTINPLYQPDLSLSAFFASWKHYLFHLFYRAIEFTETKVIALLAGIPALSLLVRRRDLLFAWCVMMIGALPILFIAQRGVFVMYLSLPGWYYFTAAVLVLLRDFAVRVLTRRAGPVPLPREQIALFGAVALVLVPLHWRQRPIGSAVVLMDYDTPRRVLRQLAERYPTLPHGARILIQDDPYPPDDYIVLFFFVLQYRDKDIRVDRVKRDAALAANAASYDHVFTISNSGLEETGHP